jgi:hypothetical protein
LWAEGRRSPVLQIIRPTYLVCQAKIDPLSGIRFFNERFVGGGKLAIPAHLEAIGGQPFRNCVEHDGLRIESGKLGNSAVIPFEKIVINFLFCPIDLFKNKRTTLAKASKT